jgi:hypothetical protein
MSKPFGKNPAYKSVNTSETMPKIKTIIPASVVEEKDHKMGTGIAQPDKPMNKKRKQIKINGVVNAFI